MNLKGANYFIQLIVSLDSHYQCEQTNYLLLGHDTVKNILNLEMVRQFSSGVEFKSEGYQTHISKWRTVQGRCC